MITLEDLKTKENAGNCDCGTSYCSDTDAVFDNNQGITSGMNSSLSK